MRGKVQKAWKFTGVACAMWAGVWFCRPADAQAPTAQPLVGSTFWASQDDAPASPPGVADSAAGSAADQAAGSVFQACGPACGSACGTSGCGGCCDDGLGWKERWAAAGVAVEADVTSFYFGVVDGGVQERFRYSGGGDYVVNLDMGKLGVQEGLFVKLRAQHRFGETIGADSGLLFPPTIASTLPTDDEHLCLTNVLFTQMFSESFGVIFGKLDTFDGDKTAFASGRGKTQFSNLGFVANPALLRTIPYSALGAGFVLVDEGVPWFTMMAVNPIDTASTSGISELYAEGVSLTAEMRLPINASGLPAHVTLGGAWSSRDYVALDQDPRILLPNVPITPQSGSWALYANFDQYLAVDPCDPTRGWGIFGRAAVSDDQANPVAWFASLGFGGQSLLPGRKDDTWGLGWYRTGVSDQVGPFLQAALGPLSDGDAYELYYNMTVTSWLQVTPDLQVINPSRDVLDTTVLAGVRARIVF